MLRQIVFFSQLIRRRTLYDMSSHAYISTHACVVDTKWCSPRGFRQHPNMGSFQSCKWFQDNRSPVGGGGNSFAKEVLIRLINQEVLRWYEVLQGLQKWPVWMASIRSNSSSKSCIPWAEEADQTSSCGLSRGKKLKVTACWWCTAWWPFYDDINVSFLHAFKYDMSPDVYKLSFKPNSINQYIYILYSLYIYILLYIIDCIPTVACIVGPAFHCKCSSCMQLRSCSMQVAD